MRNVLALTPALVVIALAGVIAAEHMPRGNATDIPNAEIQALAKSMASMPGGDQLLRVASINGGEYNVGVAVVHRAKAASIQASLEHSQITEIDHVISGSGTMVSDGTIDNAKDPSYADRATGDR